MYCKIFIIIIAALIFNCSTRLKLTQKEIDRPLSVPNNYLSIDNTYSYFTGISKKIDSDFEYNYDLSYKFFEYKNHEILFPLMYRYYLIQNVSIIDNTILSKELNIALTSGINNFFFSSGTGFNYSLCFDTELKKILNDHSWLISFFGMDYTPKLNDFDFYIGAGCGFQLTNSFFLSIVPVMRNYEVTKYDYDLKETYKIQNSYVQFPLYFGYNLNTQLSFGIRDGISFQKKLIYNQLGLRVKILL